VGEIRQIEARAWPAWMTMTGNGQAREPVHEEDQKRKEQRAEWMSCDRNESERGPDGCLRQKKRAQWIQWVNERTEETRGAR
jgi:hypothetical protein